MALLLRVLLCTLLAARSTAWSLLAVPRLTTHVSVRSTLAMKEVVGQRGDVSPDEFRHGTGEPRSAAYRASLKQVPTSAPTRKRPARTSAAANQQGLPPGSPKSLDPSEGFRQGTAKRAEPAPLGGTGRAPRSRVKRPPHKTNSNPAEEFRQGTGRTDPVALGGTGQRNRAKRALERQQKRAGDGKAAKPLPAAEPRPAEEPLPAAESPPSAEPAGDLVIGGASTAPYERQRSWADPSEDFRQGTGSTEPVPLGGTGRPIRRKATERARERAKRWADPSDDFRYGNGEREPRGMGGINPF